MQQPKRKLIQTIVRGADGRPLPAKLPDGYKLATLLSRISIGSVAQTPIADSRFLPPEAHRERCWLAYIEALNRDREPSRNGLRPFPDEYRVLFERCRMPAGGDTSGADVVGFADRWGLRHEDVVMSLRLSDHRWQATGELAGFEPPQRLPYVPADLARVLTAQVTVRYDPTEMTRSQARKSLTAELREVARALSAEFDRVEDAAADRGLRQIPPIHRSWDEVVKIGRRRVRRKKGWTWAAIGTADHVVPRVVEETVLRFERILGS